MFQLNIVCPCGFVQHIQHIQHSVIDARENAPDTRRLELLAEHALVSSKMDDGTWVVQEYAPHLFAPHGMASGKNCYFATVREAVDAAAANLETLLQNSEDYDDDN